MSLRSLQAMAHAMFEGPFGRSPGRTKFAEPSSDKECGLPLAKQ